MVAPRRGARSAPSRTGGIASLNHRLIAAAPPALIAGLIAATQIRTTIEPLPLTPRFRLRLNANSEGWPLRYKSKLSYWLHCNGNLRIRVNGKRRCVDSWRRDYVLALAEDETQLDFRLWFTAVNDQRCDLAIRESVCRYGARAGDPGRDVRSCEPVADHRIK
jgi:hypothetical protein